MSQVTPEQVDFQHVLEQTIVEQDAALRLPSGLALWKPGASEVASLANLTLSSIPESENVRLSASRRQMMLVRESQRAVDFYFGRRVVVEQMWLA